MYATVRTYDGDPDLADTLAARADEIRQAIGGIGGFIAYYLLKTGDSTTTISVFENRAGAEESSRAAAAWIGKNLPGPHTSPQITTGEAVLDF
jgi:hypothetical protein